MKKVVRLSAILFGWLLPVCCFAQSRIDEAVVTTSLSVFLGEKELASNQMITYLKGKDLKISVSAAASKNDIYIDRNSNKVVSLYEIMGKKLGFYAYDTNETGKKKLLEKIRLEKTDSLKSINGYDCNLAVLKYDTSLKIPPVKVWYYPKEKFTDPTMGLNIPGIELIEGVPVMVISNAANGTRTVYTVLFIDKSVKNGPDVFKIPSGYSIKTQEEFQKEVQRLTKG